MSFLTGTQVETLYSLAAPVTKNTYTTEAAIGPLVATAEVPSIPANFFTASPNAVSRALLWVAEGTIANTAAATFALQLGLDTTGGTKVNGQAVAAAFTPLSATTAPWHFECWITCQAIGKTGGLTLQLNGHFVDEHLASGGVPATAALRSGVRANITGLRSDTEYFLELFGTWSANSSSNTTTLDQMFLFGLN